MLDVKVGKSEGWNTLLPKFNILEVTIFIEKNDQDFQYVEDLVLFITKGNEVLSIIKRPFLLQLFIW
jgi:hypothetical protein